MMCTEALVEQIYAAVLACPHTIIAEKVTLRHDDQKPGHNALNQLRRRIKSAVESADARMASENLILNPTK